MIMMKPPINGFSMDYKDLHKILSPFVYAWDISVEISVKKKQKCMEVIYIVKIVNDFDIFEKAKEDLEAWLALQ